VLATSESSAAACRGRLGAGARVGGRRARGHDVCDNRPALLILGSYL